MNTLLIISLCLFVGQLLSLFFVFFYSYQLKRNNDVYEIRLKWIESNDKRYYQYSYEEMFLPSFRNFYGLKSLTESDYK